MDTMKSTVIKSLSATELRVLEGLCDDKTSPEISGETNIKLRTVEAIRRELIKKTGAKSSAGVVVYAVKHGLIPLFPKT